jgi:hypothetical protein
MVMEGMNFTMPPTKITYCSTKEDLVPKNEEQDKNCTMKDQKISGNTVSWHVICKDKDGTSEGKGDITYAGSTYKGMLKMTMTEKKGSSHKMTMKMSGKFLGPCTKKGVTSINGKSKEEIDKDTKKVQDMVAAQGKESEERRIKSEAIIAKVHVPDESSNSCLFHEGKPEKNVECKSAFGELDLKQGTWELFSEQASNYSGTFIPGETKTSKQECLSPDNPLEGIAKGMGCGPDKVIVKRSGNTLTWRAKCEPGGGTTMEEKGGVIFKGDKYEGGMTFSQTQGKGQAPMTTYTYLSGTRTGEGNCASRDYTAARDYTSDGRGYTSDGSSASDKAKEAVTDEAKDALGLKNPVKSIRKLFGF